MKNKYLKLSYISAISAALAAALLLVSCSIRRTVQTDQNTQWHNGTILSECDDLGNEYIDSFIFLGESTTYHLKSRGVLKGGKGTVQVWAPKSGTLNLDTTISTVRIVYPETGEELTLPEALGRKKPERMLLTFGLNGAVTKINNGEEYFRTCYLSLIDIIRASSPSTEIIIQSCFPIASDMDMSAYKVDARTLNQYIDTINGWALRLAYDEGLGYLDTQEVLRDSDGFLKNDFQSGDGYHLSTLAYEEILLYIRTHRGRN